MPIFRPIARMTSRKIMPQMTARHMAIGSDIEELCHFRGQLTLLMRRAA